MPSWRLPPPMRSSKQVSRPFWPLNPLVSTTKQLVVVDHNQLENKLFSGKTRYGSTKAYNPSIKTRIHGEKPAIGQQLRSGFLLLLWCELWISLGDTRPCLLALLRYGSTKANKPSIKTSIHGEKASYWAAATWSFFPFTLVRSLSLAWWRARVTPCIVRPATGSWPPSWKTT